MRLEEVQDGLWNIVDYDVLSGRCEERTKIITGASFAPLSPGEHRGQAAKLRS